MRINVKKQFNNLKKGAKRVFVGLLVLCMISTATGIGSLFAFAEEDLETICEHNYVQDGSDPHKLVCSNCGAEQTTDHSYSWVDNGDGTESYKCTICGDISDTRNNDSDGDDSSVSEHDHVYPDTYTYNGDGTHSRVCTVEGCGNVETESCDYSVVEQKDETSHYLVCSKCGQRVEEAHSMGDWYVDADGNHARACACGYTETHTPDYNDEGVCRICGLPEETVTIDTNSFDTNSFGFSTFGLGSSLLTSTSTASDFDDNLFNAFFANNPPTANTGLVYNGDLQVLVEKKNTSAETYVVDNVTYKYCQTAIAINDETSPGDITAKDAGTYTVKYVLKCDKYNADGLNIGEYNATKVFTVEIAPLSIDNVDCAINDGYEATTGNIDYLSATDYAEAVTLTYTSAVSKIKSTLTYNTDYSVTNPTIDEIPSLISGGGSYYYDLTINGLGNFTGTKTLKIEAKPATLLFDGIEQIADKYLDFVEIAADGCLIGLSENGSFDGTVYYETEGSNQEISVYLKKSGVNRVVKQTVSGITVTNDTTDDEIWAGFFAGSGDISYPPEAATGLVYNGQSQSLIKNYQPTKTSFVGLNGTTTFIYKDSLVYCDNEQCSSIDAPKTDAGTYYIRYVLEYYKGEDQDTIYTAEKKFSVTIASLDLSACTVLVNESYSIDGSSTSGRIDYLKTDDYAGAIILRYIHDSEIRTLTKDVDYTVTVPTISDIPEADGTNRYYLTITGKGSVTGTNSQSVCIEVPKITLTFNNGDLADYYIEYVNVGVKESGYVVGLSQSSDFATTQKYKGEGEKQTVVFYVKEQNGTNVAKRTASNLTIRYPHLLFDSKETQNPFYVDCVVLSANYFTITKVIESDGTSSDNETTKYTRDTEGLNQSFTLVFKDAYGKYDNEIPILVENINIYKNIDIEIKYNGGDYQQWFNKDVTLTAKGYKIADPDVGAYRTSYTFSETGENVKLLNFQATDPNADQDPKPFTIIVRIDRTAPTGSITLDDATSKTFTTKDSVLGYVNSTRSATIDSADDLSGVDYVLYYVSDTFYNSSSELTAAISEKSAKWRSYSTSSKPATVKDKKNYIYASVYDKAGNNTYLSLGSIIYDTVAPKMVTNKAVLASDKKSTVVAFGGTDDLSGINRFKLMVREKTSDSMTAPSKDEIFNNGTYVEVKETNDKTAAATHTLTDLELNKIYMFYFAAVDRAGNISDVTSQEVKGSDVAGNESTAGGSSASGSGSGSKSSLPVAPNGIAGSGSGSSGSKGGNSASQKTAKTPSRAEQIAQTNISRNPYIADATGNTKIGEAQTSGWDKISSEVKTADKGAVIEVEMSGLSNVSSQLFASMKDRDVTTKLRMAENVEWEINSADITNSSFSDIDLGVRLGSKNIPATVLSNVVGTYPHVEFMVNHNGDFGFTATLAVPVGTSNAGMNATLFHYDEDKKELEFVGNSNVDSEGYARFKLSHASDYTVVVSPQSIFAEDGGSSVTEGTVVQTSETLDTAAYTSRLRLTDLFAIRGGSRIWLFFIAFISAGLCIFILFAPQLQIRQDFGDDY